MKKRISGILRFFYQHKLLFSAAINLFLMTFYLVFYMIIYETNDDNIMSRIVSGFWGENDPHMAWINYILGDFLKLLYSIDQAVPWYDIIQFFVCYMAATAMLYFLLQITRKPQNIFPPLLLDIFITYELFGKPQFTKTASLASAAGIVMILYFSLFTDKINKRVFLGIVFGCFLALVGYMYRNYSFFMILPLCSCVGMYFFINDFRLKDKQCLKKLMVCGISFTVLIVLIGIAVAVDNSVNSSEEWKDYYSLNAERAIIQDNDGLKYYNSELAYEKFGIDEVDTKIIGKTFLGDSEFFSAENLKKFNSELIKNDSSVIDNIKEFSEVIIYSYAFEHYIPFWVFLSLVMIVLVFKKLKIKDIVFLSYIMAMIFVVYYLLSYKHRYLNRLSSMIFYISSIAVIMMLENSRLISGIRKNLFASIAVFLVLQSFHTGEYKISRYSAGVINEARAFYSEISEDPQHLYVLTASGECGLETAYGAFSDIPFGKGQNIYELSWFSYSPSATKVLNKYKINNLAKECTDNDKVCWLDDDIDGTVAYIRKHYNKSAKAELYKMINGRSIYRIVSKE